MIKIPQLRKDKKSAFFKEWQGRAKLSKIGKKRPKHSKFMKELIKNGGLPHLKNKTLKTRKAISKKAIQRIKKNGHPRGMLGKKHTDKFKKIASERFKKMWKNPNCRLNSNEHRQYLSDKAMKQTNLRTARNCYSRCKQGKYNINGKEIYFRSGWEPNYALYLDFLIKQKQIKKWEYEVDTFWFEKIKRGVRSYKPDFKVFNNDGSFEYHEVKGWMDAKSKTKLRRMAKYYPEIKMVLIDAPVYNDIKKKLGAMLKFF